MKKEKNEIRKAKKIKKRKKDYSKNRKTKIIVRWQE